MHTPAVVREGAMFRGACTSCGWTSERATANERFAFMMSEGHAIGANNPEEPQDDPS